MIVKKEPESNLFITISPLYTFESKVKRSCFRCKKIIKEGFLHKKWFYKEIETTSKKYYFCTFDCSEKIRNFW